jgi:hypothetical protein
MVVLPIFTVYFMLHVVFKGDIDQLAWCGLGAGVMVNLAIVLYVRMAYSEDGNPPPEEEALLSVKVEGGKKPH